MDDRRRLRISGRSESKKKKDMVRIIHYTGQGLGSWQIQIGPVTVPSRYWWLIYGFWSYDADHPGSALSFQALLAGLLPYGSIHFLAYFLASFWGHSLSDGRAVRESPVMAHPVFLTSCTCGVLFYLESSSFRVHSRRHTPLITPPPLSVIPDYWHL